MRRLILLRHGQAEAHARTGEDIDRALTERGVEDAREVGRRLAEAGYAPDAARVSAARRAIQTWQAASAAFTGVEPEILKDLYNADAPALLAEAAAAGEGTVLVVAHNPGVHQLAADIGGEAFMLQARGFPPAAAAVFERERGGSFRLLGLFYPQEGRR